MNGGPMYQGLESSKDPGLWVGGIFFGGLLLSFIFKLINGIPLTEQRSS